MLKNSGFAVARDQPSTLASFPKLQPGDEDGLLGPKSIIALYMEPVTKPQTLNPKA